MNKTSDYKDCVYIKSRPILALYKQIQDLIRVGRRKIRVTLEVFINALTFDTRRSFAFRQPEIRDEMYVT